MSHRRTVRDYHQRTKHHLHRYAASAGFLDWETQPHPFRRFEGVPTCELPLEDEGGQATYDGLFRPGWPAAPVNRTTLGRFLYLGLALSAWKEVVGPDGGIVSRWSLRVNPSSGNLHPTEGYILVGEEAQLETGAGLYHYAPDEHLLELRGRGPVPAVPGGFLLGLSSIPWREAWKYGERAFRYCQHDVGHALAALALAGRFLGWQLEVVAGLPVGLADRVLGTDAQQGPEREVADVLVRVTPVDGAGPALADLQTWAEERTLEGLPNPLSPDHRAWEVIDDVSAACHAEPLAAAPFVVTAAAPVAAAQSGIERDLPAAPLIRGRRSAVSMDGSTGMDTESLARLLGRLLPGAAPFAYAGLPGAPQVSLVLFIHRVEGLAPGLYALVRDSGHRESLQQALRDDFTWNPVAGVLENLPFHHLASGNAQSIARQLSCHQDIAADGAFSLGMLARFDDALEEGGAGWYPRLFWETGAIGQLLYLEAEAAGLRGTGIGCYFDDEVHRLLGLTDSRWQILYHFTVGGPVEDPRLRTAAPYAHLKR